MISLRSSSNNENMLYVTAITLTATLGGMLFGYDTSVIAGAIDALKTFFIVPLTLDEKAAAEVIAQVKAIGVISFLIILGLIISFIKKYMSPGENFCCIDHCHYQYLWIGLLSFLRHSSSLNEEVINVIHGFNVSSAVIGCIIGGSMGGYVSQNVGRRNGLILSAILLIVSAIGSAIPDKMNFMGKQVICMFMFYRLIGGIGVGLASMLSPMYIAEIAPAKIRGRLVSYNQFAIIFGMVLVSIVNYLIAKGQPQAWIDAAGWRWMFASEIIPAVLFLLLLLLVPETPRYLVLTGKESDAQNVLNRIYGNLEAKLIFDEIRNSLVEKRAPWLSYGGLVLLVGILLSAFQQFVGINSVLYYAPAIFMKLGFGIETALLQTIIVNSVNLSFTIAAILLVDKIGRKPLMTFGAIGMGISMASLGFTFYLQANSILALIFILSFIACFAFSWGPVTWVLLSEIFPNSIKGAMGVAVAAQWLANLLVSITFP